MEPLREAEISYLGLLRNEILARHGYEFDNWNYKKIFKVTRWYITKGKNGMDELNETERGNIEFIKRKERSILLAGERMIRGWQADEETEVAQPRVQQHPGMGPFNKGELKILKVTPTKALPGGKIKVIVTVKNTGGNVWGPIGKTRELEDGKYYVSSCWVDPRNPDNYAVVDQFPLPKEVKPGESVKVSAVIEAPIASGRYALQFSILQSMVQRFLDVHLPSASYEFEHCPKVIITVKEKK